MCLPVGPPELIPPAPSSGSTAAERAALGAQLHAERAVLAGQVKRRLSQRQAALDLREDGVSAFIAEMFRRLETRSAEHRAMRVEDWARVVWGHALAEAVRHVDAVHGYPVRRAQRARRGAVWIEYTDEEPLLVEDPMIRAARMVLTLRPQDAQAVIDGADGPRRGESSAECRARRRLSRRLTPQLRALLKAHL
jgi:hypothetical protein